MKVRYSSFRRWSAPVCGAALCAAAAGCSGSSTRSTVPSVEPSLTLVSVTGAGAGGWSEGARSTCVELGTDADQTVVAQVRIEGDWLLRPLHNCENRTHCGVVEVQVASEAGDLLLTRSAASLAVNLPLGQLPAPQGSYVFTARLLDQFGNPYVEPDAGTACGGSRSCPLTLTTAAQCSAAPMPPGPADAAVTDAASGNPASDAGAGAVDASAPDGAVPDASSLDASLPDASVNDAALPADSGPLDATVADSAADAG